MLLALDLIMRACKIPGHEINKMTLN